MNDLANSINRYARSLRKWIFLDCCASAAAYPDFQPQDSDVLSVLREEIEKTLPASGTVLFCACSADQVALNPEGGEYTMFSGALLEVLHSGDDQLEKFMTLREIAQLVEDKIFNIHEDKGVRPQISTPDSRKGDLAFHRFFPNPAKFTPRVKELPETLRILLEDADPLLREGAIRTLGAWLLSNDEDEREIAQSKLNELRQDEEYTASHSVINHVFHISDNFSKLKDVRQLVNRSSAKITLCL
jgi:hypothetical protein